MNSLERKEARYQRRKQKREDKLNTLVNSFGTSEEIFNFKDMYKYGLDCCKNVMWKGSVQTFRRHLFSRTAVNRKRVLNYYKPKALYRFTLTERGKTRHIEAPHIDDRQIQKTLTKKVLLPLYSSRLIYDNGASLENKGLIFSQNMLDRQLRKHIKKYGYNGFIIIADCKGFFPNANRDYIKKKHLIIPDNRLREIMDIIIDCGHGDKGMPLGVEPSQVEMIAYTSELDHYMTCQLGLRGYGHYMDDYHILVPPDRDPYEIYQLFKNEANKYGITISDTKTKILPFGKNFKFCKITRILKGDKIIKRGSRDSAKRTRRKFIMFANNQTSFSYEDIFTSAQSSLSYFLKYNNHSTFLRLTRLFYSLFGENIYDYLKKNKEKKG